MGNKAAKDKQHPGDIELLRAVSEKDPQAFSLLYERHSPKLFGLALQILKDQTLAEDILQDTFLVIWKNAKLFDARKSSPTTWLTVLCRNRCIDKLRAINNKQKRSSNIVEQAVLQIEADPAGNPFHLTEQSDIKARITKALQNLPQEQRSLIEMAYFAGFSQSEISDKLEIPLGTVKTRIRLGMQKLKGLLAGVS